MDEQSKSREAESDQSANLEAERARWEIDKLNAKRRLIEEVIGLVRHDSAINAGVTRLVESMATLSENDPAAFWNERSTSGVPSAKLQFPLPPFPLPPFPFPIPHLPVPLPIPSPGDVFGQIADLIKAEKAMIQDLIKEILS